jgi:hypothetical protein
MSTYALYLRTVSAASSETGCPVRILNRLIKQGKLKEYKIGKSTYISLLEFEQLAKVVTTKKPPDKGELS